MFLVYVVLSLFILICVWLKHYSQHFQCKRRPSPKNIPHTPNSFTRQSIGSFSSTEPTHSRCWCKLSSIDGEEFDFFPMSFLFYLTLLIAIHVVLIAFDSLDITLFEPQSIRLLHFVLDYVLVYTLLVVSLWVSLFSFYRYYTTSVCMKLLETSMPSLIKRFSLYGLPFAMLFLVQIHFIYWLFPLVLICFICFNFYCTYYASAMLIKQCRCFLETTTTDLPDIVAMNEKMLQSIVFTKHISLICCVIHSSNLAVFTTYKHHMSLPSIILYLSLSWCVSGFIFSLNFVRNMNVWRRLAFRCKSMNQSRLQTHRSVTNSGVSSLRIVSKNPPSANATPVSKPTLQDNEIEIVYDEDKYQAMGDPQGDVDGPPGPRPDLESRFESKSSNLHDRERAPLHLYYTPPPDTVNNQDSPPHLVLLSNAGNVDPYNMKPTIDKTTSARTYKNKRKYKYQTQSTRHSSRRKPKALQLLGVTLTPLVDVQTGVSMEFETIDVAIDQSISLNEDEERKLDVEDHPSGSVSPESTKTPLVSTQPKRVTFDIPDEPIGKKHAKHTTKKFKKSQSAPMANDVLNSYNIMAQYGFCSRKNVNSVRQLNKYQETVKNKREKKHMKRTSANGANGLQIEHNTHLKPSGSAFVRSSTDGMLGF